MNCPKCSGDTQVVDSRKAPNNTMRRRRECTGCGHRFTTYESTISPKTVLNHRARNAERMRRQWRAMSIEERRAHNYRARMRAEARAHARETGEPTAEIYRRWGCE